MRPTTQLIEVPAPAAAWDAIRRFALTYNGYNHTGSPWGGGPHGVSR